MKESDLYLPLKRFLEAQGYEVKGEVGDCDAVAVRGDEEPIVVELKLSLNLSVILQAVERLSLSPTVYIGIPERQGPRQRRRQILKLLKMVGIGLLAIHPTRERGSVTVLLDPGDYQPRQSRPRKARLLGEFARRVGDPNLGGSDKRRGVMTVYRQRSLAVARHLRAQGPDKAARIARSTDEPKAREILYRNVYGWFERVAVGVYELSPRGREELPRFDDPVESAPQSMAPQAAPASTTRAPSGHV